MSKHQKKAFSDFELTLDEANLVRRLLNFTRDNYDAEEYGSAWKEEFISIARIHYEEKKILREWSSELQYYTLNNNRLEELMVLVQNYMAKSIRSSKKDIPTPSSLFKLALVTTIKEFK